jgi:long-chain acyl-CoA synthetase
METVVDYFWTNVCEYPHVQALAAVNEHSIEWLTWSDLGRLASAWITRLQGLKIDPGGHVASCYPNSLEWIVLDVAAQTLGLVHVAIDVRESPIQRAALFEFSGAAHLLQPDLDVSQQPATTETDLSAIECRRLANGVDAASAAQMLFTSGSNGSPKGVLLSHRNLAVNARAKLAAAPQLSSDLRLNVLPFAHAYARTCELSSWIISRGQLAIADNWPMVLELGRRLRPTLMNLVPYWAERAAAALEQDPDALGGRVRLLQVGGAALGDDLWRRLSQLGLPPLQGYGLTEASPVVCSNRAGAQRPGSVGPPVAGVEVRVDSDGVLWCSGPNVMLGYWQDAAGTRESVVEGWLCTGDLAEIHPDGHLSISGRASQQIVLSTGYKVTPEVIERELCNMPGVHRAVVLGHGRPHVVALLWRASSEAERGDGLVDAGGGGSLWGGHDSESRATGGDDSEGRATKWGVLIRERMARFPAHAIPTQVAWVAEPLTSESGLLTLKGSLRRGQISERYSAVINALYAHKHWGS